MQSIANPRSNLAQSHYSNFFTIKKRVWETLSMTWFFMSRGDRIRTCALVLPKHLTGLVEHYFENVLLQNFELNIYLYSFTLNFVDSFVGELHKIKFNFNTLFSA